MVCPKTKWGKKEFHDQIILPKSVPRIDQSSLTWKQSKWHAPKDFLSTNRGKLILWQRGKTYVAINGRVTKPVYQKMQYLANVLDVSMSTLIANSVAEYIHQVTDEKTAHPRWIWKLPGLRTPRRSLRRIINEGW